MSTNPDDPGPNGSLAFLRGGGEMGERMRAVDWGATALGPAAQWPAALRLVIRLMLTSNHPVFVFWGLDHVCFYNDAYSRSLGPEKHPSMLGASGRTAWQEIWSVIGPQIELVMRAQGSTWHENQLIPITRHGRLEPVYWTYSYSPIDDDAAPHGVGGVMVMCTETTEYVEERRSLKAAEDQWRQVFEQAPGFMCTLRGPKHRFEFVNPGYLRLLGRDREQLLGEAVLDVLPEVEVQGFVAILDEVRRSGTARTGRAVPLRLKSQDGGVERLRYVDFVYQPIRNEWGGPEGIFVLGSDVTEQVLGHRALADSEARYRALVDRLPGGAVFVVDTELRYVTAGAEALAAAGVAPADLIGREVGHAPVAEWSTDLHALCARCITGEPFEVERRVHGCDYVARGTPVRDEAGSISGALVVWFDITARTAAEAQLRAANTRLEGVMAAAEVGTFVWDLKADAIRQDANLARLYGFDPGMHTASPEDHFERVHPDDVPAVKATIDAALRTGALYIHEFRVVLPDGAPRWLAVRGKVQHDAHGQPVQVSGLVIDIDALKSV